MIAERRVVDARHAGPRRDRSGRRPPAPRATQRRAGRFRRRRRRLGGRGVAAGRDRGRGERRRGVSSSRDRSWSISSTWRGCGWKRGFPRRIWDAWTARAARGSRLTATRRRPTCRARPWSRPAASSTRLPHRAARLRGRQPRRSAARRRVRDRAPAARRRADPRRPRLGGARSAGWRSSTCRSKEAFERRVVRTGVRDAGWVAIASGLEAGSTWSSRAPSP